MKASKRLFATTLALLLVCAILSACTQSPASTSQGSQNQQSTSSEAPVNLDPIKIPYIGPMTGDNMQYGVAVSFGMSVRIEEFNAAGGLNGRMLELSTHDDKNDAKETVNVVNSLLDDPDIFIIFGPFSSTCSMAVSPIMQKAEILHLAMTSSHPDATQAGDWIFRGSVTQAEVQKQYASFVYNRIGHRKIAILYLNNDWGKSVNDVFCEEFEKLGGTITDSESFMEGQTKDFTPMLTKMKSNDPDGIFIIAQYNDTATALNQMTTLNIECTRYISDSAAKSELLGLAGENCEGALWVQSFFLENPSPVFQNLRKITQERLNKDIDSFVAAGYDNTGPVFEGLLSIGEVDKYKLKEYLTNLKDYPGLAGNWGYDETRSPTKPLYTLQIKDQAITLFE